MRLMRHLKSTINLKPKHSKDRNRILEGCCDTDWANNREIKISISKVVFIQGSISCQSKHQNIVAMMKKSAIISKGL